MSYFCIIDESRHTLLGEVIVEGGSRYETSFALFIPTPTLLEIY